MSHDELGRRILLHTMATPERDPIGALELAVELGLGGIELICQPGYRCGVAPTASLGEARELAEAARRRGVRIGALSPYARALNAPDERTRRAAIEETARAIALAEALDCPLVRMLAGDEAAPERWEQALPTLTASLRELVEIAAAHNVTLAVENHMETMALSARQTMEIVTAVGRHNVGVIYDQANLSFLGAEEYEQALALQAPAIRHTHVKDFRREAGRRLAAVPGEGVVPWPAILARLTAQGYTGWYSLEYETRWFPHELPPPEVGLRQARDYLSSLLALTEERL